MTFPFPAFCPGALKPPSCSFIGFSKTGGWSNTYTFPNHALGDPAANRLIVIGVFGGTFSGCTIGGVAGTKIVGAAASGIGQALVPAGATGNIVVNYTYPSDQCSVGVWALYDLLSITPLNSRGGGVSGTTSILDSATVPLSIIIGTSYGVGGSHTPTCSWTGATETYDAEALTDAGVDYYSAHSGAFAQATATETRTIRAAWAGGSPGGCAAVWR